MVAPKLYKNARGEKNSPEFVIKSNKLEKRRKENLVFLKVSVKCQ